MLNRPRHKPTWTKAPCELIIEGLQDGCCGCHPGYLNNCESQCHPDTSHQVLAQSNLTFGSRMRFEDFKDGHNGGHLRYRNRKILAILNLYVTPCSHQVLAQSALWFGRCRLKNFKWLHGGHLENPNGTNLAVLNLHVSKMPPTKFQINLTFHSGADVVSRWPPWWPFWIL